MSGGRETTFSMFSHESCVVCSLCLVEKEKKNDFMWKIVIYDAVLPYSFTH